MFFSRFPFITLSLCGFCKKIMATADPRPQLFIIHYSSFIPDNSGKIILVLKIMPYILYIVIILEHIEELTHALKIVGI